MTKSKRNSLGCTATFHDHVTGLAQDVAWAGFVLWIAGMISMLVITGMLIAGVATVEGLLVPAMLILVGTVMVTAGFVVAFVKAGP